tara:strand:- start:52 stop:375 length:324 start_codon:yes stop_codon:yes gene_type:complete
MIGAAVEDPFSHARHPMSFPALVNVMTCPALFARFQVVPPSLVISRSTLVPVGSQVIAESSVTSLIERASLCILDVTIAELDDGVPIQSAAPLPLVMIFRFVVEVGQ